MATHIVAAAQFKAECLHLMEEVKDRHITYVITKRGKPIAKLVPIVEEPVNYFGYLKGTATATGDMVAPLDLEWDAEK